MAMRENIRPGGRSARVQASVHKAVHALLSRMDRNLITIPSIASEAGVTPSTIYRRWGDLQTLLADVAAERLRPDMEPAETGSALGDLSAWAEQFTEEMSSDPGRQMIRDVLAGESDTAGKCCSYTRGQLGRLAERAARRGETFPDVEQVIDHVVAPVMYRILFSTPPDARQVRRLVESLMQAPAGSLTRPPPASIRKSA